MFTKLKASILCFAGFLAGCDRAPVPEEQASIYQKAVHYNALRPAADKQRDKHRKPVEVLELAQVQPGDKVIDLLGGGGWYTELLSQIVGDSGHVYLVNSPLFVNFTKDQIAERLKDNRLENVTRIDGEWNSLGMPSNVDMIFLVLAYHDIYVPRPNNPSFEADPEKFFEQMHAALKPGGKILVIDHAAEAGTGKSHAPTLHRIDEAFAKEDFIQHGFTLLNSSEILKNPNDDFSKDIWEKGIMHRTSRFIHVYQK